MAGLMSFAAIPIALGQATSRPAASQATASQPAQPPRFAIYERTLDGLGSPAHGVITPAGEYLVAEPDAHQIRAIDVVTGETLRTIGKYGSGEGEFVRPHAVAVAPQGQLFVADTLNHRVQVFYPCGGFVRAFGGFGAADRKLCAPEGVAADERFIYVADTGNDRVQVFDHEGRYVRSIGRHGSGRGEFNRPVDIACGEGGRLFVCDADNARVQWFAADGAWLGMTGGWGQLPGWFANPGGIDVHEGRLYVADSGNHRVQVFEIRGAAASAPAGGAASADKTGSPLELVYEWGTHVVRPHEGEGRIHYPNDVAVAPDGGVAVVSESFENRAQVFRRLRPAEPVPQNLMPGVPDTLSHFGPRIDIDGRLLALTEPDSHSVLIFDLKGPEPIEISRVGSYGSKPGQFVQPADVEIDTAGRKLYVLDSGNWRLQMFGLEWSPEEPLKMRPGMAKLEQAVEYAALTPKESPPGAFPLLPVALERVKGRGLLLLDARNYAIMELSDEQRPAACMPLERDGSAVRWPVDLAVSADGQTLFVTDEAARRVDAFSRDGRLNRAFGTDSSQRIEWRRPFGVAALPRGGLVVCDAAENRIGWLDVSGALVRWVGKRGLGAAEFFKPMGVAVDGEERVYVLDWGNHRGLIFAADGGFELAFGARSYILPARPARK